MYEDKITFVLLKQFVPTQNNDYNCTEARCKELITDTTTNLIDTKINNTDSK
jgi:hypothetical protein